MRIFKSIGVGKCLICGTSKKGKCFLAGMDGTGDGHIEQAKPVHIDCLDHIRYSPEGKILYMRLETK
jgi:hypothetical protein